MNRHPYGQLQQAKRSAAKEAASQGEPIAVIRDGHEPVLVRLRKRDSFLAKHVGAQVMFEVYP